ncbi:MAG: transposase family protein [Scytonematopsis contorta HA4267-MV1]|jgi:transposase|nr:transposase family protein [Scytonematopsis contorta HA4267-MV1]
MNYSHLTALLSLPGVEIEFFQISGDCIVYDLIILSRGTKCPKCTFYTEELHQVRQLSVRDLPAFGKEVYLQIPRRQFYCKVCHCYITERLDFIDFRRKYTQRFEEKIYKQADNFSLEQLSKLENIKVEEIKNIVSHVKKKNITKKTISILNPKLSLAITPRNTGEN